MASDRKLLPLHENWFPTYCSTADCEGSVDYSWMQPFHYNYCCTEAV